MPSPLRLRVVLPAALLGIACAGGSKDNARPDPAAARPPGGDAGADAPPGAQGPGPSGEAKTKSVCSTIDYGHDRPNAKFYLTFPDDAAALKYAQEFLSANGLPGAGEISHDEKITTLVDRIYAAFRKIYPRETQGFDAAPRVVSVGGQGVNAFTGFDDRAEVNKGPWLLFVHGQALGHSDTAELAGMFAHELGHLVTRNLLPETRARIRVHYRVPGGAEGGILGAATADDPAARTRTEEIREIGQKVGRHTVTGSMPLSPYLVTDYESLLDTLEAQEGPCKAADDGIAQMKGILTQGASVHEYTTLKLTADQNTTLRALATAAAGALRKCYPDAKTSLFELKVRQKSAKKPAAEANAIIQKELDPATPEHAAAKQELMTMKAERDADADAGRPTIERLLGLVEQLHRRLSDYEADTSLPIDELRVFDMEEDADDAAVRVLKAIGEDPLGNARIWVETMPDPAACYSAVSSGKIPAYGRFVDPHNDTCWRYYHATQFAEALARCPASASPSGGAAPTLSPISPADPSPMQLILRRRASPDALHSPRL